MRKIDKDYEEVGPTILRTDEIYEYLNEILEIASYGEESQEKIAFALRSVLCRLLDGWEEFENPGLSSRLLAWVENHWRSNDVKYVRNLLSIVIIGNCLDANEMIDFCNQKLENEENPAIRELLESKLKIYNRCPSP